MSKKLCIIYANCQGEELETLLSFSPAFRQRYEIARYTNYIREEIPEVQMRQCSLFLYQHLDGKWGNLASASLLAKLPSHAVPFMIPNLFFNGYWPLWRRQGPTEFNDWLLNRLIGEKAPKPAILKMYLHSDITRYQSIQEVLDVYLAQERHKESLGTIPYVDYILEHFTTKPLFYTINHPGEELLVRVANYVLDFLGLPELPADTPDCLRCRELFPSYSDFFLPVHPQVAAYHGLAFAGPGEKFRIFHREMTFEEYTSRYIDCLYNECGDILTGYLQVV